VSLTCRTNQKQELIAYVAMFVIKSEQNKQYLYNTFHRCFRQNSVYLVKQFQRRFFFRKSTNQKQELPMAAMFVNGLE
jgi:hypothetical protein